MTGEIFRFGLRGIGVLQIIDVNKWSEGYDPPRIERGRGHFHVRLGNWQIRTWKAIK